jgi:hypothetical protein
MVFDMISSRFLASLALCVWVACTSTSPAESATKLPPGKVVVAQVVGKVEATHPDSSVTLRLRKQDSISEKHTVTTGVASSATLVFSNGSTINLPEKSSLQIAEFLQNPFSAPFAMAISSGEPTTSSTKLNLIQGEVVCNVKKLRTDEDSSFAVSTPVGAAGIRGTIFAVSYTPNVNGTDEGIYILSVTEGSVELTDNEGNKTLVTAGKEVVIRFKTTTDPVTGKTITEILSTELRDIPADRLNRINEAADKGKADSDWVIFDATEDHVLDLLNNFDTPPVAIDPRPVTEVDP